jgi:hypothetical protein
MLQQTARQLKRQRLMLIIFKEIILRKHHGQILPAERQIALGLTNPALQL